MCCSRETLRERGASLLEVMVTLAIIVIIAVAFSLPMDDSFTASRQYTADTQLRQEAQRILGVMMRDLHSTQAGSGNLAISTGSPRMLSFNPITSVGASGPNFGSAITYSWDPAQTTAPGASLVSSVIVYTNTITTNLCGDVASFSVTPVGTTQLSGYSTTSPVLLQILIQLSRQGVYNPDAVNPDGRATIIETTEVAVPAG